MKCKIKSKIAEIKINNPEFIPNFITNIDNIINIASKEGDVVLDCFMGVGSTAEAALKLNRKFIGVELEPEYMELTKKRLEPYL